jgi:hypothetical protein
MDPMPTRLVLCDDHSALKRVAPELRSMTSTEPQTYGSREQADLCPGSIFAPSSATAADSLDTGSLLPPETDSTPSRPSLNLVAPENRWRSYRLIEGVSLSSPQRGHNPRPRLSPETELEL